MQNANTNRNENILEFCRALGAEFAAELNQNPGEAQNWELLEGGDLPDGDYLALENKNDGEVTREMESAYRAGFNAVFQFIGK